MEFEEQPVVITKRREQVEIEIRKLREHYIIFVNGQFHCSCDSMREVDEEIVDIRGKRK